jgi:hypothetical protein
MVMRKMMKVFSLAMTLVAAAAGAALATPSTQIWIPSTDIQAFKTVHLGIDNYFRASSEPYGRDVNVMDVGLTAGILPFEKIQAEIGFDYLTIAANPNDNHPFSFNAKIATPEDSIFKFSPALAVGIYNCGPTNYGITGDGVTPRAPFITSGQNIVYALAARTLPIVGRISAGGYHGSARALQDTRVTVDPTVNHSANDGVLVSWDRTMTEITDKLWLAVDYMGGNNVDGAVSFGASWAFSKNVSLIFGYDIYTKKALAGANTFTTQLDINIP